MKKEFRLYLIYYTWFYLNILSVKPQLIYTDEVPFIFYTNLQVFPTPSSSIIDFSSKQFQTIPDIILGIQSFNQIMSANQAVSFHVDITNISKISCQIESLDNQNIQELTVSILAIDKTNFPNIQVIKQSQENIFQSSNSYEEVRQFSQKILNSKGIRNAVVFLNGWTGQSGINMYSVSVSISIMNDQYYKLKINRRPIAQIITNIYYTIVEYAQDNGNNVYNIMSNYDQQYSLVTDLTNCLTSIMCADRHVISKFQIPDIQNIQIPKKEYQNIFIGFSSFEYKNYNLLQRDPNIALSNYNILTSRDNQKLQGNQCLSDCINVDPMQPLLCLDCQLGQYFLQDLKICQSTQPSPSYTCYPEKNYQTCVLCSPIQKCQACQIVSNQLQCIQCEQNYYIYKGTCQLSVSQSSSVSDTAQTAAAISLVYSTKGSNFMFLTLQKLNLLYMINILFTSELTIFINQIKGTNPIIYFQHISFFSMHIFVEFSQQVESQQLNSKVGQTSLLINGGDQLCWVLIFTFMIILGIEQDRSNQVPNSNEENIIKISTCLKINIKSTRKRKEKLCNIKTAITQSNLTQTLNYLNFLNTTQKKNLIK
ncbi:hypothetical protein ABPG72_016417 [Tetrahymena utriculariae]